MPPTSMGIANPGRWVSSENPSITKASPTNASTTDSTSIGCFLRLSTSNTNLAPMMSEMMPIASGTTYIEVRLT